MTPSIRPLIAGNWKMHGTSASIPEILSIGRGFMQGLDAETDAVLCLPATLLHQASQVLAPMPVQTGGQDCHAEPSGAHTGDISAEMLKDAGAHFVIVGHSERRTDHHETNEMVSAKARAAWRAGLIAIICIGETQDERERGLTLDVLSAQVAGSVPAGAQASRTIIAYEPIWAIGTGLTPTDSDVAEAHTHIRRRLAERLGKEAERMRILYGGSVKPDNAARILAVDNVDGALVGGASLKAADFLAIAEACRTV
jgi:triosephosphate isomerase